MLQPSLVLSVDTRSKTDTEVFKAIQECCACAERPLRVHVFGGSRNFAAAAIKKRLDAEHEACYAEHITVQADK